jgi:hypothetical protein
MVSISGQCEFRNWISTMACKCEHWSNMDLDISNVYIYCFEFLWYLCTYFSSNVINYLIELQIICNKTWNIVANKKCYKFKIYQFKKYVVNV